MIRQGNIDSPPKTPFILGLECAGDIEEIGAGVEGFKVKALHNVLEPVRLLRNGEGETSLQRFYINTLRFYY